jgi:isopentenyl-diphosphate delta-isomerase
MQSDEYVILVDHNDQVLGSMEKMEAHQKGKLHRAFSIFIFNHHGHLLLQQRALSKYHSVGKWTNTCCSHPHPGEVVHDAANRRLMEEMGMTCKLRPVFNFIYQANLDLGMIEHEFDHVFFGVSDAIPKVNKKEVMDYKYSELSALEYDIQNNPANYTEWLKACFSRVKKLSYSCVVTF